MFFQFFNSNIGYFCMCYLRPYHPVVIAVVDVLCFDIAPEAQQAIRFAEREGVPLHTTDLLQPTSRVGKMAQTTAENIPWLAQAE